MDMSTNARLRNLYSEAFAATLRAERARLGLDKQDVAKAAGIPPTTYGKIESGERVMTSAQLGPIAAALGMSMMEFARRAEETMIDLEAANVKGSVNRRHA